MIKYLDLLIANMSMKIDDKLFLLVREKASPQVRPDVVGPSEATAFPTAAETGQLRQRTPATMAVVEYEIYELLVFLRRPRPFLYP